MKRVQTISVLCFVVALSAAQASAHRLHVSLTTIERNAATDRIEIVHQVFGHDLEFGWALDGADGPLLENDMGLDAIGRYAAQAFRVRDADGAEVPLDYVGAEEEGEILWIYQEAPGDEDPTAWRLWSGWLFDWFPEQSNQVNVHEGDRVISVTFRVGEGFQALSGEAP